MPTRLAVLVLAAALLAVPAGAAVYVSVAPDGTPSYTDAPRTATFRPLPAFGLPRDADLVRGQYAELIERTAAEHRVDPNLVRAIIRVESNFQPLAVSRKGARGLMQLMPATADRFAVANAHDPAENIRGGVKYFRTLLDMFPGQVHLALAAYNAGENAVLRYGGIPPYPETREYVARVLRQYDGQADRGNTVAVATTRRAPGTARIATASARTPVYRSVDANGTPHYSDLPPLVRPAQR